MYVNLILINTIFNISAKLELVNSILMSFNSIQIINNIFAIKTFNYLLKNNKRHSKEFIMKPSVSAQVVIKSAIVGASFSEDLPSRTVEMTSLTLVNIDSQATLLSSSMLCEQQTLWRSGERNFLTYHQSIRYGLLFLE